MEGLVNLSEIAEIEMFILRRMKEFTLGDHASVFKGSGFNFVGIRDWEPGDRVSSIDWAQSSMTNFSPLITREFEQDSNATIVAVADASMSTRCGAHGVPIAAAIARSVAAVGLSAVFFQDLFGLITFDDEFRQVVAARPRIGKPHVMYCLELYQQFQEADARAARHDVATAIEGHLRRTSLVPVISDFLFADPGAPLRRCASKHDLVALCVRDLGDAPPPKLPPIRVRGAEDRRARVWRSSRGARASVAAPLREETLRALGADWGELWTGARLLPSLVRFFSERARRRA